MGTSLLVREALLTQPEVHRGPDGDMAESHRDPQTLPHPHDSPSLPHVTICQLDGLNTLNTESQSPKHGHPGPLAMPLSSRECGQGERQLAVSSPAPSGCGRGRGLLSVHSFFQTTVQSPGVKVRGEEGQARGAYE